MKRKREKIKNQHQNDMAFLIRLLAVQKQAREQKKENQKELNQEGQKW